MFGNLLLVEEAVVATAHSALRRPTLMLQKNPQRLTDRARLRRVEAALKSTIKATKRVLRNGILPTHDVIEKLVIRYEHCYPFISNSTQEARAKRGEISAARPKKVRAIIEGALDRYVGSTQVHLIGDELWGGYPAWRRENGAGRHKRNGVREVSDDMAQAFADKEAERRTKVQQTLGIRVLRPIEVKPSEERVVPFISDSTIRFEMSIFGAVMNYAIKKRYVPASQRFDERPKLKSMRRDEFTLEEYRKLHTVGRKWIAEADKPSSVWYRTITYNMILITCNTGMRPAEMKNLRWRDIMPAKDREGREIVVLFVQGKGKSRKLVAPRSVGDYLERIRVISKATEPNDRVFTNVTGKPAKTLYSSLIADLLNEANL